MWIDCKGWVHHIMILFVCLSLTATMSFFCHRSLSTNIYSGREKEFELLGDSVVSVFTMRDRWIKMSAIMAEFNTINEKDFSVLMSNFVETYNHEVLVTHRFNDTRAFYNHVRVTHTISQYDEIISAGTTTVYNYSWPVVLSYPFTPIAIGFDVGMTDVVRKAIDSMEKTGEPDIINVPKDVVSYVPGTILYGAPLKINGSALSFIAIRMDINEALVKEMRILEHIQKYDITVSIDKGGERSVLFSSHDNGIEDNFYEYKDVWTSSTIIYVGFSEPRILNIWFFYLTTIMGVFLSILLTYIDIKYEQKGEISAHKSRFLGRISHEMRTPMNGILGTINGLHDMKTVNKEDIECICILRSCVGHLLNLVMNVLCLSQIESGKVRVNHVTFKMGDIKENVQRIWCTIQRKDDVELEIEYENIPIEAEVLGDQEKIEQVMYNLISNAVRFTENGKVTLRFSWSKMDPVSDNGNIKVTVRVIDTGIGIDSNSLSNMFKPFVKLANNKSEQGCGIGLNVSRSLSVSMGGNLKYRGVEGTGSEFEFDFCVFGSFETTGSTIFKRVCSREHKSGHIDNYKKEASIREDISTHSTLDPKSVLIVDDNIVNIKILKRLVEKFVDRCDTSLGGFDAIDTCRQRKYDIIFMDKFMPVCDGLQATIQIRKSGKNVDTCIVFVTADANDSSRDECIANGATEYVTKPIDSKIILNILEKYISI